MKLTRQLARAAMALIGTALITLSACGNQSTEERSAEVTVSAYTMRAAETKANDIGLAAWGDTLKPGMKAIAVSRDLIPEGLDHMTKVSIEGLDGTYIVRDKMNKRWTDKIDIFMGNDVDAALEWGTQTRKIYWVVDDNG